MDDDREFQDHFSGHAAAYAEARPTYPPELFAWLATESPGRACAWDCATGNGQAAIALAEHFDHVIATDASAEQLRHAFPHPRIEYRRARAETPDLPPASIELIIAAQAVHWLDRKRFYATATRTLREGGLIAVWCYSLFQLDPDIDGVIAELYEDVVGPYWPPERRLIDEHYRSLEFPFTEIPAPEFQMRQSWTLNQVLDYLHTWSAVQRYMRREERDPVQLVASEIMRLWGAAVRREVRWPLFLRAGRPA